MKKFLIFLIVAIAAFFAYDYVENNKTAPNDVLELEEGEAVIIQPQFDTVFDASEHTYKADTLMPDCEAKSEITCAVELAVKCTINPKMDTCTKDRVPAFVFMEDESLERPTEISYQITKIMPIDPTSLEVHTKSDCNGMWFGLCKGNVIYVLDNVKGYFRVKDVYSIGG